MEAILDRSELVFYNVEKRFCSERSCPSSLGQYYFKRLEKRFSMCGVQTAGELTSALEMEETMKAYTYTDKFGSFHMEKPERNSYLYFPLAGECGLKSSITPLLGGDSKVDQNTFLLQPVSAEELHNLKSGRNFWCVLEDGGAWSAAGASAETESLRDGELEEDSALDAGLMWHRISRKSKKYPLSSSIVSFVPCDKRTFEVMEVTVENHSDVPVTIVPVAAIPLYGRSADNVRDHRHVTSLLHRMSVNEWGVEVTPTLTFDERGHKKNTLTYFVYGVDENGRGPAACCPVAEDFIGEGGSFARPGQIYAENGVRALNGEIGKAGCVWKTAGAAAAGGEAVGALLFEKRSLAPGEKYTYCIYMGITPSEGAAAAREGLMAEYSGKQAVEAALERVRREWIEKTNVSYETGDEYLNGYLYWVTFQPILRRLFGCSFLPHHDYGKGGRGWRDLWQDCLALLIMEPEGVRDMLVSNYGGVRMDGTNATIIGQKPGEFVADRNNITRVWMDHGLWPFMTTEFYIRQTGDIELFAENVPYFKDRQICRGEQKDEEWTAEYGTCQRSGEAVVTGTVLEHILLQNITAFYDVGEHNHIRLRGADWNDAYDMAPEKGESVTFTAAYAGNLENIASLMERYADTVAETMEFQKEVCILFAENSGIYDSVEEKQAFLQRYYDTCRHDVAGEKQEVSLRELAGVLRGMARWMKEHIRKTEWVETSEGAFYNGYYDNHSRKLEGSFPGGVRMTLTSQVFPIMSGTATEEQISSIARAADKLLFVPEMGGYKLNTDFGEVKEDMGRAFGFAYGHKENGAVFSHMAVMYGNALYKRGFIREGYKALDALYRQAADFERSRIYPGLPEYFSDKGRGLYHYLTGSASWLMMTMVTEVYGVKGEFGDLALEPKLVKEQLDDQGRIGIRLTFGGVPLHVCYEASEQREVYTGVKEVYLDGVLQEGCVIPKDKLYDADGGHEIRAIL